MKSLLPLLQPLGLVWLLLGIWVAVMTGQRRLRTALVPAGCWLLLTLVTCTPLPSVLMSRLESAHAPVAISSMVPGDAIVCLGGAAEPSVLEPSGIHLKTAADRLATGFALLAQQKAPLLVMGGGGYEHAGQLLSEADGVVKIAREISGGSTAILSLGICADTHDEAVKVSALCQERGWKRVLLVTSAYHMPRAAAVFAKAGVPVVPVPCNYMSSINRVGGLHWFHLPHSESFAIFSAWLHEVIGMQVYRSRSWM